VQVKFGAGRFLQSWLYYKAELEIAKSLPMRLKEEFETHAGARQLQELFPDAGEDDLQVKAATIALCRRLTLITGGPGTGKTHTLVRILAMLVGEGVAASKIRLAASTGKAAERMKKAVGESLEKLPDHFCKWVADLKSVAARSATLHSLLGYNPSSGKCKHNEANPLPCEVLIVDECSMVDVLLWRALLKATPANARLILVGDPNQLESVGQGNVLAAMARVAGNRKSPLHAVRVHLTEARRFKDRPGILNLARALENLDAKAAGELLGAARGAEAPTGIAWLETSGGLLDWAAFPKSIQRALASVAEAETPRAALNALGRICILTAQREYFVGAKAMSAAMEMHFSQAAPGSNRPNQPIIINQNDPETGLRNGSVGVITTNSDGVRKAWFPGFKEDDTLREFSVAQLPDYSPAWALTIHRSQGSEFDEVLVCLPRRESPMATRELIYTAITRARKAVYVAGDLESIMKAAANPSSRMTMAGAHLESI
jgi:exodeoxyribonuclease V alpha subunit